MKACVKLVALFLTAVAIVAAAPAPAPQRAAGDDAKQQQQKQYMADIVMTGMKGGKDVVLAAPKLIAVYGQEARFLAGGEVPVDLRDGGAPQIIPFGLSATLKVNELSPDRLPARLAPLQPQRTLP